MTDLPAGFVLDTAPTQDGGLPEGFVLDQPQQAAASMAPRGIVDQLTGATGERYQTWPERLVRGIGGAIASGVTLPRDVYQGQVNPESPEATGRVLDLATISTPINPAYRLGSRFGAPPVSREPPPGQSAAVTAAELGAPLPRGVASDSRTVQAITQASRQMPFVGQQIEERTAATIGRAGEAVDELATSLGASDRASVGANLRTALDNVVTRNKDIIDESYAGVRGMINSKNVVIPENTRRVFDLIVARRMEAGQPNPISGLEQIENIVTKGVNFDGMIRAKSDLASTVDFLAAHGGFSNADKKQLGAAMSRDLGEIAARSARPGARPDQVVSSLRSAEAEASKIIESNKTVGKLLANKRDEGLATSVLNAAGERGGNLRLLGQLKRQLAPAEFEQIAGTVLGELGHNPAIGQFSLNKFATAWEKLSPRARELMFPKGHGRFLNDIAELGRHLKGGERYMNTSGTGRAAMLGTLVGAAGTGAVAAVMGNYAPLLGLGATAAGGFILAKGLARPAVAASMARVARAALAYQKTPSVTTRTNLLLASKDATSNLASWAGTTSQEFMRRLTTAEPDQSQDSRPASFDERFQALPAPAQ
jgi:hypothetical protein